MAFDGLTLAVCVDELKHKLPDAKIQKILMPGREEIVLMLYSQQHGNIKLVLNADAGNCSVYLTTASKPNPKTAPAFCMLLRKYLAGARILSVDQHGLDRVVSVTVEAKDELMQKSELKLIAEIMGKHSNIILVGQDGRVLDCVRRVSVDVSSKRQVLPGSMYLQPPTEQYNPLQLSMTSLEELVIPPDNGNVQRHLSSTFQGMSTQTANEIIHLSGLDPLGGIFTRTHARVLASVLHDFYEKAIGHPQPCIQTNDLGLPVFFSAVPYQTYPENLRQLFPTCNGMLDYYYTKRESDFLLNQKKDALLSVLKKNLAKLNKKIKIYMESLEEAKKADDFASRAQLITANIYRLKKGMNHFEAQDFTTGETVAIPLDLSLTPSQNAQKLFKKVSKLKTAQEMGTRQLEEALDEREFLENTMLYVQKADEAADLDEIQFQMVKNGLIKEQQKKKALPPPESSPREFTSPAGYTILVGKNDRQNEMLTMRMADKNDIWFHAKNMPGSHVLLLSRGAVLDDIDDDSILMAAGLAAKYSAAKQSGKTPVDYTQRYNVKKTPASRPGKVIYDHYFTLYVEPV
jgi:predicted ribosome quality control (RQC) complex YloA/Tae2 family protein